MHIVHRSANFSIDRSKVQCLSRSIEPAVVRDDAKAILALSTLSYIAVLWIYILLYSLSVYTSISDLSKTYSVMLVRLIG